MTARGREEETGSLVGWMVNGKDALAEGLFVSFARDESESAHAPHLKAFLGAYFMSRAKRAEIACGVENRSGHQSMYVLSAS